MRSACCTALVVLLLGAGLGPAEEPTAAQRPKAIGGLAFVDEVEVTVVNLNVHVTDKDGRPVTDLAREDFRVFQDGDERQITNFELYTEEVLRERFQPQPLPGAPPTPTPAADAPAAPEVQPVYLALYVDNEHLRPFDRNRVMRQMQDFLRQTLRPPVQMMVVTYQKSFKVALPFTSDPEEVLDALRGLRTQTGGMTERDNTRRDILDKMRKLKDQESTRSGYDGNQMGEYHTIQRLIMGYAREEYNDVLFAVDALRNVLASFAGLPGRKAIIYVSNGLPMVAGIELFYEFADVYQDSSMLTFISQFDRSQLFESLAASANAQGVSFYTIDGSGLDMRGIGAAEYRAAQSPLSATMGARNLTDTLVHMARETGGLAVVNTNDVSIGLEKVRNDLLTYYSIGYPLASSGGDKVHTIKVELPNHPQLTVRCSRRFVEKSIETRVQDMVMSGLIFGLSDNPMELELSPGAPAPATSERWSVPLHVSFPLERVALIPEGPDYVGRVTLFIAARDDEGKQSDMVRQEHEIRVRATDYEQARRERWGIDLSLLMESGRYRAGVGLLDLVTRQPSYTTTRVTIGRE